MDNVDAPDTPAEFAAAVRSHQAGDLPAAEAAYRKILASEPGHADCLHLLGVLDHQRGRHGAAEDLILRAIESRGDRADYRNNLGTVLRAMGRLDDAIAAYREAIGLGPRHADARANLGVALHESGRIEEAASHLDVALSLDPDHVGGLFGLANLLGQAGDLGRAIALYRRASGRAPHRADILNNLGGALASAKRYEEAAEVLRRAVDIAPDLVAGRANLGGVLENLGRLEEAADAFAAAARLRPDEAHWPIRIASLCPSVFPDRGAVERYRIGLEAVLDAHRAGVRLAPEAALSSGCIPPFNLPHHGHGDRRIKEKFARLFHHNFPPRRVATGGGPLRVGFLATHPHQGGFLRVIGGIIERLDPARFAPVVIGTARAMPAMRAAILRPDAEFVAISDQLGRAADGVAAARCDVLYHWQVGTDTLNYFLAHHRLAPVQCTSWGSHVTTGVPTMDYFLSSEWIEPEDADDHYSESLIRLPTFPTFEPRMPRPSPPATRAEFGLPVGAHLYMCLQRPAKFHPDFDPMLAGILRRDPRGLVVALEDEGGHAARLRGRFAATMPDVAGRVAFLPRQPHAKYLRLLSLADVVLDTPYFGSGHTGYDTLGLALPMVTLPGRFKVGRYALAYYRRMGIPDLVAATPDHYADLAAGLGIDRPRRDEVAARIVAAAGVLFEDERVVREHERFFEGVAARSRADASGSLK